MCNQSLPACPRTNVSSVSHDTVNTPVKKKLPESSLASNRGSPLARRNRRNYFCPAVHGMGCCGNLNVTFNYFMHQDFWISSRWKSWDHCSGLFQRNQYVTVLTYGYRKLTWTITTARIITWNGLCTFLQDCIILFRIPAHVLTKNGTHFKSKFFATLDRHLDTKQPATTVYHSQTNGQIERYNETVMTQLYHYAADHQRNWDIFVQPLTYACNK